MGTSKLFGKPYLTSICFSLVMALLFSLFTACDLQKDPVVSIKASPEQISYNENTTLTWQSSHAGYCMLNGTKVDPSGSLSKTLTETTKYTITAYGDETTASAEATVTVAPAPAPTITVTVPFKQINYNTSASFSWFAQGFIHTVTLDGKAVQNVGSYTSPALYGDTEYVLVATGPGGSTTQKVQIEVYVPTRTDTISSRYWKFISIDRKKINDLVWVKAFDLAKKEIEGHYFFHARGWYEGIYEGASFSSCSWDWIDKTHIKRGSQIYTYSMTDKELILYYYDGNVIFRDTYRR